MNIAVVGLSWFLVVVSLVFVAFWWSRRHIYRLGALIPGPTPLPLIGNAHYFVGDYRHTFKKILQLWKTYGNTVRIYFGPLFVVLISNGNDIEAVIATAKFNTRDEYFMKPIKSYLGEGLLTGSGEVWKRHRKVINPTFSHKVLDTFIEVFNKNSEILVSKLESYADNTIFDIQNLMALASLDMVHETVLGVSIRAMHNKDSELVWAVERGLDIIRHRFRSPWLFIDFIFNMTKMAKEQKAILKILDDTVNRTICMKLEEYRTGKLAVGKEEDVLSKKRSLPFLELMIEASETEGDILSPLELRDEVSTLAIAGIETTSTTNCFVLAMLSIYPEHQQQVFQELQAIFGDNMTRAVTPSDLSQMKYLERVIKETLRLYPTVPAAPRIITEDLKLSSYTIPAGTVAGVCYYTLHRDPKHFPDPEKFDPDRFLPEAVAGRPSNSYMPFGMGPRMCIGSRYAMLQIKTVIANVLRRYEVLQACTVEDINDIDAGIVLRPAGGFKLKMLPRTFTTVQ